MLNNSKPMMIDSHAHLDYEQLSGDLEGVLARAAEAGVSHIITIGVKLTTAHRPKALADAHDIFGVRLAFIRTRRVANQTRPI